MEGQRYVGRGGEKLNYALEELALNVNGSIAADFGCNIGGFTDCLLQRGAEHVYAVDTGYGALEWKLRKDPRVEVMERTNAMHVQLPEPVDLVAVDVAWTRQRFILPNALRQLAENGFILSLFKPQYEAEPDLVNHGVIDPEDMDEILQASLAGLSRIGVAVHSIVKLPHTKKSKNPEAILHILPGECDRQRVEAHHPGDEQ